MSIMNKPTIEEFINCILHNYTEKDYQEEEMVSKVKILQTDIICYLQGNKREMFDETFYEPLISIIDTEEKKIKTNSENIYINLSFISSLLGCLRNSFFKAPDNQKYVAENAKFRKSLLLLLKTLVNLYPMVKKSDSSISKMDQSSRQDCREVEALDDATSVCVTTFVNMMAGNPDVRKIMWPYISPLILNIVSIPNPEVGHKGAALLHQFLVEEELKHQILQSDFCTSLLCPLLKCYIVEGSHSCFALFCLETLLESPNLIPSVWKTLPSEQSLLILDILSSLTSKETTRIPVTVVNFLKEEFKRDGDKILRLHNNCVSSLEPSVIARVASFLSTAGSSDHFRDLLQKDKSLLISTVYLLKGITDIGDVSTNAFSRLPDAPDSKSDEEQHPCYGFKSDLIRLIAGLTFRNKSNQDTVRDINGLLLLLENSQYDSRNPFIREASILALRNVLEGNEENQKVISSLKLEGVADNKVLDQLGMEASVSQGKLLIQQK